MVGYPVSPVSNRPYRRRAMFEAPPTQTRPWRDIRGRRAQRRKAIASHGLDRECLACRYEELFHLGRRRCRFEGHYARPAPRWLSSVEFVIGQAESGGEHLLDSIHVAAGSAAPPLPLAGGGRGWGRRSG